VSLRVLLPRFLGQINMLGYLPEHQKVGYVGGWLGDLGGRIWAVGPGGLLAAADPLHIHFERWPAPSPAPDLVAVAAPREDLAFAVGAVGAQGVVLSFDGAAWLQSPVTGGAPGRLLAVSCGRTGVCVAVGEGAAILSAKPAIKGARGTWTPVSCSGCSGVTLRGVWVGPMAVSDDSGLVWAVGDSGAMVRWDFRAGNASAVRAPNLTTADLYTITATPGNIFAAGQGGTIVWYVWNGWRACVIQGMGAVDILTLTASMVEGTLLAGTADGRVLELTSLGPMDPGCMRSKDLRPAGGAPVHAVALFPTRFCGYYPRRSGCFSAAAAAVDGLTIWPDSPYVPSWSHPAAADPTIVNGTVLGVSAAPSGVMRLPLPPPAAEIVDDATGLVAATVPLELRAANWHLSREDVWAFNFSALKTPGMYRARVAGIGSSPPFPIADSALDFGAYTAARALYYQRCGYPGGLQPPFADPRFARPACHLHSIPGEGNTTVDATGKSHATDVAFHESLVRTPLYAGALVAAFSALRTRFRSVFIAETDLSQ
jgi:hypothetical protein